MYDIVDQSVKEAKIVRDSDFRRFLFSVFGAFFSFHKKNASKRFHTTLCLGSEVGRHSEDLVQDDGGFRQQPRGAAVDSAVFAFMFHVHLVFFDHSKDCPLLADLSEVGSDGIFIHFCSIFLPSLSTL